jgi:hypothetical protein
MWGQIKMNSNVGALLFVAAAAVVAGCGKKDRKGHAGDAT